MELGLREREVRARQLESLSRAFGDKILACFRDKRVIEIMLNTDGRVWIERAGEPEMTVLQDMSPVQAMGAIQAAAALVGTVVNADKPILECELSNGESVFGGARLEALIPPVVASPVFAIRKKAELIFTLSDYVEKGILSPAGKAFLENAVAERKNILICGGTGTGKTTFANAMLAAMSEIDPHSRIVIIEDTLELQCAAKNVVFLRTSDGVDQTHLLRATMRLRPDRIVVGEVRDKSALALLKAWNTGHPGGLGTVHANDARAALVRLGQLIQEAGVLPVPELIAEAVDVVVSIKREAGGRRIDEIVRVIEHRADVGFVVESVL
jgi:type IV secretion system protein VirB11